MKKNVIEKRLLLMNEDDCYWIKMTVNEWRQPLMIEDNC